jgi:putative endonuclease
MYYCYIVRCTDGTLYTGVTTDLARRLNEHNAGKGARYTASRRPVQLLWKEKHPNRSSAQRREAAIKRLTRLEKEALIRPKSEGPREILRTTSNFSLCRLIQKAGGTFLRMDQDYRVTKPTNGWDTSGPFWTYGFIRVERGKLVYLHGTEKIAPPAKDFALFLPPYTLAEVTLLKGHIRTHSFTSKEKLPGNLPVKPVLFRPRVHRCPESLDEVVRFLRGGREFLPVSRELAPPPFAEKIKKLIDQTYAVDQPLSALAQKLRIPPSTLSRSFKRTYGLPPVRYRHSLRILDAMMRLLEGEEIVHVCQEVGFSDLSRFYKLFGEIVCGPPARYRTKLARNLR